MSSKEKIEKIEFKPKFVERYSQLTDFEKFKKISLTYLRRSIRVNTIKSSVAEIKKGLSSDWTLTQIPWCKEGFWIEGKRRDVGNLNEHALGHIYIQEAASMIPPIILDPKPGETVLDMCASPGSKSTQIAALMKNQGVLVANDFTGTRTKPLEVNMQRCGISNEIITKMHGQRFKNIEFDKILVDAPCSGTGTIRKSFKTLKIWNPGMIKRLAHTQKTLLQTAFDTLKKGGVLVYSTCSLEPEEDEGVVSHLLENNSDADLVPIKLDIVRSEPVNEFEDVKFDARVKNCLRIWPQDNDTEGFFVAKIVKK